MKKCFVFTFIIILLLPMIVNAESVQTRKFKYMPAYSDQTEEVYYYSDDYFRQSGKVDNEHLVGMSFNLAISTFEIQGASYSTDLLNQIGFKDVVVNDMVEKPTLDTIGTVIAHKEVDGYDVVSVAIRGEKYDSEWGNNFIVGKSGNAKGFDYSSKKVISRVKKYIQDNNLSKIKIWMAGYSRAGTIADLTGVYINKNLTEFKTTADDIYVYTFEAPSACVDKTIYENIYNIINENDIIPCVYPKEWGFYSNGKTIKIDGASKTITTYKGLMQQEEYGNVEIKEFYGEFFSWLTTRLTRAEYSEGLDEYLPKIIDMYFKRNSADREKLLEFLMNDVKNAVVDNAGMEVLSIFDRNSDGVYETASNKIIEAINIVKNTENGKILTNEEYQTLTNAIYPILRTLGPIIVDDSYYYEGIDYDKYYASERPNYYLSDSEYGTKSGKETGFDRGYNAALFGEPEDLTIDEYTYEIESTVYRNAFAKEYKEQYPIGYQLGLTHFNDPYEKGKYDGKTKGEDSGYYDGSHREERNSDYLDHMSGMWWVDEEDEAVLAALEAQYEKGFKETFADTYNTAYDKGLQTEITEEPEEIPMYHFATLIKDMKEISSIHHPQNTLIFIHALDSYYALYSITEGENQTIDINQNQSLTVKTSGHLEKLVSVQVDNQEVDSSNYELKSGSTIVTLKDSYLKTLAVGTHMLKLNYIDNTLETTFTIVGETNKSGESTPSKTDTTSSNTTNPKTGDDIYLYTSILSISTVALLVLGIRFKKEQL